MVVVVTVTTGIPGPMAVESIDSKSLTAVVLVVPVVVEIKKRVWSRDGVRDGVAARAAAVRAEVAEATGGGTSDCAGLAGASRLSGVVTKLGASWAAHRRVVSSSGSVNGRMPGDITTGCPISPGGLSVISYTPLAGFTALLPRPPALTPCIEPTRGSIVLLACPRALARASNAAEANIEGNCPVVIVVPLLGVGVAGREAVDSISQQPSANGRRWWQHHLASNAVRYPICCGPDHPASSP